MHVCMCVGVGGAEGKGSVVRVCVHVCGGGAEVCVYMCVYTILARQTLWLLIL